MNKLIRSTLCIIYLLSLLHFEIEAVKAKITSALKFKMDDVEEGQIIVATSQGNTNNKITAQWIDFTFPLDSVNSQKIIDSSLSTVDFADNSINSTELNAEISTEKIADNTIEYTKIQQIEPNKITGTFSAQKMSRGSLPVSYVVDQNGGGHFTTLQSALYQVEYDASENNIEPPGARVYIQPGIYDGEREVYQSYHNNLVIEGAGESTVLKNFTFNFLGENITLQNFTLMQTVSTSVSLIFSGERNFNVFNCTISGGYFAIGSNYGVNNINIIGNKIVTNVASVFNFGPGFSDGYRAIVIAYSKNVRIEDNFISFPSDPTVTCFGIIHGGINQNYPQYASQNICIKGNTIEHQGGVGVYLAMTHSSSLTMTNNIISGNGVNLLCDQSFAVINNNIFSGSNTSVLFNSSSQMNCVSGNIADGSIAFQNTANSGNAVFYNIADSISINGADTTTQPGNTTSGNNINDLDELNAIF